MGRKTRRVADWLGWPSSRFPLWEPRLSRITASPGLRGRDEELLDIGAEAFAVDRAVERAGRIGGVDLRRAARSVAVFHLPCGTLSTRRSPFGSPAAKPGHVGLGPRLVDEGQTPGIPMRALIGSPAPRMPAYVGTILLARDEGLFLNVTPILRKKRLIIEVSALTPRSGERRSIKSLKRDVRLLNPRRLQKVPVRH